MATYAFGHTNPDSDSIIGAISLSYLKNKLGEDCIASRQGAISPETEFILNKFGGTAPILKNSYSGENVYILDFSDYGQAPKDIKEATILGIIDHHKLGNITTSAPIECWIRPIGCTNTVIKEMYEYYDIEIPKDIAGMMLCAILSDTIIFKSPTCTKIDTKACKKLAHIAGIDDYKALGMEMFIVKSNIKDVSFNDLIKRDYKEFEMGDSVIGIGQLEVVDLSIFDEMKKELLEKMQEIKNETKIHSIILLLTDIIKEGSQILVVSEDETKIADALECKLSNSEVWLNGVLSRKKQIIPLLEPAFK